MYIALNVVPTLILLVVIYRGRIKIKEEIKNLLDNNYLDDIFTSFCITFIGFNVITSMLSLVFHTEPKPHITTPIMYIYAVLFSPIIEELICRKYIFGWLNKYFPFAISALIGSLAFSIPHFSLVGVAGYIFIGMVWSHYYKKSNNILVPIISHFLFNYITILIMSLRWGG